MRSQQKFTGKKYFWSK